MSPINPTSVEVEMSVRLVTPDSIAFAIRTRLFYGAADPYAVRMLFHPESAGLAGSEAVSWSVARELLATGLKKPDGIGDVKVRPLDTWRGKFVELTLTAPDGEALLEVPYEMLLRFLRCTHVVVPFGREADYLDLEIERLLMGR